MSELTITSGERAPREVLAAGTLFISENTHVLTFDYGGRSVVVRPLMEQPPRGPNGNYLLPLPEGALLPDGDALHRVGEATVYVQLRRLARHPKYLLGDEFLFIYEVTRPAAAPQLRSVA